MAPARSTGADRGKQVADVLTAADIPASKLGPTRHARLTEPERDLYSWILRQFRNDATPSRAGVAVEAKRLGLDFERALATMAREDLVHLDDRGEIAVAYPFSGRPTPHIVRFPGRKQAYAMCALDALGIAPMFDEPIEITSNDPHDGKDIQVRLEPTGAGEWSPESTVVVTGVMHLGCESSVACCPVLNFFGSVESAR